MHAFLYGLIRRTSLLERRCQSALHFFNPRIHPTQQARFVTSINSYSTRSHAVRLFLRRKSINKVSPPQRIFEQATGTSFAQCHIVFADSPNAYPQSEYPFSSHPSPHTPPNLTKRLPTCLHVPASQGQYAAPLRPGAGDRQNYSKVGQQAPSFELHVGRCGNLRDWLIDCVGVGNQVG